MANWKNIVAEQNRKAYQWPAGWDTREEIAEQLECSPERIAEILAPAIRSGDVERASFPVWDPLTQRKVMVVGYRKKPAKPAKQEGQVSATGRQGRWPFPVGSKVCRIDAPQSHGIVIENGAIRWENTGRVSTPKGSTIEKLRLV